MKYFTLLIFFLSHFVLIGCNSKPSKPIPKAKNGVLDLQTNNPWNFKKDGIIKLDGEWDFFWLRLIHPKDFLSENKPVRSTTIEVPSSWNGKDVNTEILEGSGYATYRLLIPIPESEIGQTLGVKISYSATASRLWVNGKIISEDGQVGVSRKDMTPRYSNQIHSFVAENPIEILIHISNFNHKKGGLWQSLAIGTEEHNDDLPLRFIYIT